MLLHLLNGPQTNCGWFPFPLHVRYPGPGRVSRNVFASQVKVHEFTPSKGFTIAVGVQGLFPVRLDFLNGWGRSSIETMCLM